jgi:hypothetical protein
MPALAADAGAKKRRYFMKSPRRTPRTRNYRPRACAATRPGQRLKSSLSILFQKPNMIESPLKLPIETVARRAPGMMPGVRGERGATLPESAELSLRTA